MRRCITISDTEAQLIKDIVEYVALDDDKERDDFIEKMDDDGLESSNYFGPDGLLIDFVPKRFHTHIYFKCCRIEQQLREVLS
jgi:hypothetical protein